MLLYFAENYSNLYLSIVYDYGRISTVHRKILLNPKKFYRKCIVPLIDGSFENKTIVDPF